MMLIRQGTLVSAGGARRADILIAGEQIAAVAASIRDDDLATLRAAQGWLNEECQTLDAAGLLIFPGLIDVHIHAREPGATHKEDWHSATCAAVAGGVTTVFAMPNTSPPVIDAPSFAHALALAQRKAVCDFGLYLGATNTNQGVVEQTPDLGECGLKMYMGSSTGDLLVQDFEPQYEHFARYPRERVIAVHAEHEPAVRYFARRGVRRPPICADLETARAITLAQHCRRPVHICHLSTRREIELVREAKSRGLPVTCEVAPHHLFLTLDYELEAGARQRAAAGGRLSDDEARALFQMNPPLRELVDLNVLWENLDAVDCIATDHAPHTLEEKRSAPPPSGVPGLETLLPLLLTAASGAHGAARLTLADIARLCCEGPARVFGLTRKGTIAAGYDADLSIVDPNSAWTIGDRLIFSKCGWTPFAGWPVLGAVRHTFVRGRLVFDGHTVVAPMGSGRHVVPNG
jgi:dihydroorotase (multifunctional complex type)